MPVWLRRFHIKRIEQFYEEEQKAREKADKKHSSGPAKPGLR